jgi:tetratricopeptide (TPR) repeat protein
LLSDYGIHADTVELQLSYAHFLAFYLNKPNDAITFLKQALNSSLPRVSQGKLKLKLGDVLVMQEKFNEALIYYSQIQTSLKNSKISQQARFRVAKTSYYKGDFKWAESQLKILKASTSQLIDNDALDLKLLISDNKLDDSTHTALKLYSKADLYIFQNKKKEALTLLDQVIANHKTESIMDQALLLQAKIYEEEKNFEKAEANYLNIIANYREDILADDALYALAELYVNVFEQPEKAKPLYEQIIFNHADSIYFVEARKKFRQLRGDDIN